MTGRSHKCVSAWPTRRSENSTNAAERPWNQSTPTSNTESGCNDSAVGAYPRSPPNSTWRPPWSTCNAYTTVLEQAAKVKAPTTLILGERDMMTPLKSGRQLASAIAGSNAVVLPGAGHMLTAERPDDVLFALAKARA